MRDRDACIRSAVLGIGALCSSEVEAAKARSPVRFSRTRRTNNGIWCSPAMRSSWQKGRKV